MFRCELRRREVTTLRESVSDGTTAKGAPAWNNLPNRITVARLLASIVLFVLLANLPEGPSESRRSMASIALWLFVAIAVSDWLDGWCARRYGMVTAIGRILDPFVDKITVCGTYILLLGVSGPASPLRPWMAVAILGREFLVNDLRSWIESRGVDFSAKAPGKIKMILQCITAGVLLARLEDGTLLGVDVSLVLDDVLAWSTLLVTVGSGIWYAIRGMTLVRRAEL